MISDDDWLPLMNQFQLRTEAQKRAFVRAVIARTLTEAAFACVRIGEERRKQANINPRLTPMEQHTGLVFEMKASEAMRCADAIRRLEPEEWTRDDK